MEIFNLQRYQCPVPPVAARRMLSLFRASEGTLAMKMVTLASKILLLQEMKIPPNEMYCGKCEEIIPDTFKQRLPELPPAGPCCQLCSPRYHSEENIGQTNKSIFTFSTTSVSLASPLDEPLMSLQWQLFKPNILNQFEHGININTLHTTSVTEVSE